MLNDFANTAQKLKAETKHSQYLRQQKKLCQQNVNINRVETLKQL